MGYIGREKEVKAMSQYTTGEIAKLCGVTVRTVQYYDARGILIPSALSEGGRRLYSEDDLKRLKVICFCGSWTCPSTPYPGSCRRSTPKR